MARALSSLIAFALLFAAASASTTTEHDHAHTTDQEPGSTTTGGPVSAAWAPRGLSLWAVLAFLVMLIADPVAANTTTEHDHAHTTDQEPASTTTGVVSGAPPGAASVGAVALVGAVAAWASL